MDMVLVLTEKVVERLGKHYAYPQFKVDSQLPESQLRIIVFAITRVCGIHDLKRGWTAWDDWRP